MPEFRIVLITDEDMPEGLAVGEETWDADRFAALVDQGISGTYFTILDLQAVSDVEAWLEYAALYQNRSFEVMGYDIPSSIDTNLQPAIWRTTRLGGM